MLSFLFDNENSENPKYLFDKCNIMIEHLGLYMTRQTVQAHIFLCYRGFSYSPDDVRAAHFQFCLPFNQSPLSCSKWDCKFISWNFCITFPGIRLNLNKIWVWVMFKLHKSVKLRVDIRQTNQMIHVWWLHLICWWHTLWVSFVITSTTVRRMCPTHAL